MRYVLRTSMCRSDAGLGKGLQRGEGAGGAGMLSRYTRAALHKHPSWQHMGFV